jgi:hypothetical protein
MFTVQSMGQVFRDQITSSNVNFQSGFAPLIFSNANTPMKYFTFKKLFQPANQKAF